MRFPHGGKLYSGSYTRWEGVMALILWVTLALVLAERGWKVRCYERRLDEWVEWRDRQGRA